MTEPTRKQNIAVIGAGIGGLSAAYDLTRAGKDVTVIEASDHPAVWQPASKSRIGIGRWNAITTIGSPPINICSG